ncbi:DUF294 nucleotidyltransferase-like domain-containing protein [Aureibaculum sp. 2210JD6-5]|uniref:DUF294 nucleotidyltransferase-like domain-containing protein n=1 Tax=Aureibaculum sp. 2210JD6-5 TaxID=3103957 RepID=UPI002AAC5772|nr:DUF294 nucleotidyltransferase-like domain-containing protein [Aureibaculum sp. 2210JD6-5]MDY7395301.1 DUF294 nucleotidyltransferase-like domain-containing protein [Aureibaculum sp. 2210JD6-5]
MKNSIAERVKDFIKKFPPFDLLNDEKLKTISEEVKIIYLEKGKTVFSENEKYHEDFYIVRNGAVGLYRKKSGQKEMVDICDGGDIFGLRALLAEENYTLEATANEESIIYAIPIAIFQRVSDNDKKINKYLITTFASNAFDPYTQEQSVEIFQDYIPSNNEDISNLQSVKYTKKPIKCKRDTTVKEAAIKMSQHNIGCIVVVNSKSNPVGIVTNSDLKHNVATGKFPIDTEVKNIMSSPVKTCKKNITIAEAQLQMIKYNIDHLCVTKDGTSHSALIGILTQHDILISLGNSPSALLKEIKRAQSTKRLRSVRSKTHYLLQSYLDQNIPIRHITKIISGINDAITYRVIENALRKMDTSPPVQFIWLALGSQGRSEQLLYTDQDSALVFENVPKNKYEETQAYFLKLSGHITKSLHKIGYEYCPAEMMASNPQWCMSLTAWKNQFESWILRPNEKAILLSSIFFDYNIIYGNKLMIESLTDSIFKALDQSSNLLTQLAKDILISPPPLGFFRQLVLEKNGEYEDFFNIKVRALMPLIDAARLLILSHRIKNINNTALRYETLAELEPENKELYDSCSYAFKALLKFKTKQGLANNDSGKFINLETLSKEEKLKLKRCFKPIREIQELLKFRFRITN